MANTVCHIEIFVPDFGAAQKFYGSVFDWSFREFGPDMTVYSSGDQHVGAFCKGPVIDGNSPSVWIQVDDVNETLAKVSAAGGSVVVGKEEVPNVGWSGTFADPFGSKIGIVQFAGE